jgi:TPR repeat protein
LFLEKSDCHRWFTHNNKFPWCCLDGKFIERNYDEAIHVIHLALEFEEPRGLELLADCYIDGLGVETNAKKTIQFLDEAADLNIIY